jgi:hypothetical protein
VFLISRYDNFPTDKLLVRQEQQRMWGIMLPDFNKNWNELEKFIKISLCPTP